MGMALVGNFVTTGSTLKFVIIVPLVIKLLCFMNSYVYSRYDILLF